jgi:hypothetical protein
MSNERIKKLLAQVDRAKELEAEFATKHPAAERFMREVIDALVRMGI